MTPLTPRDARRLLSMTGDQAAAAGRADEWELVQSARRSLIHAKTSAHRPRLPHLPAGEPLAEAVRLERSRRWHLSAAEVASAANGAVA